MESEKSEHKTPPKFIENFPLDIREEMGMKNTVQSSPFRCMPNFSTPPSRFFKIKNPFEAALNERLHLHVFSPSVFQEVQRTSDKFKWTIDDISSIRPAPIDVSSVHQQFIESSPVDDRHVQAKIEKYFSETHKVPSPLNEDVKIEPLILDASPCQTESTKETCDSWTQTVLTLPAVLPPEVEKALEPYFTFHQDQNVDEKNSSLCRRLFQFHEEEISAYESLSPVHSEISCLGSPLLVPPSQVPGRNFDPSPRRPPTPNDISPILNSTPRKLSDCEFSPISSRFDCQLRSSQTSRNNSLNKDRSLSPILTRKFHQRSKSASRLLDYSENMSIDNSFNLATENDLTERKHFYESPLRTSEHLDNSCNWEMEYNNLSLNNRSIRKSLFSSYKRSNSESSMDISHHTTPKSNKSYSSQRKKLSDSFKLFDNSDSERESTENQSKIIRYNLNEDCKTTKNDYFSQNTQDTGYNTCSELSQRTYNSKYDDEIHDVSSLNENKENNWKFVFASTPTKKQNFQNIFSQ